MSSHRDITCFVSFFAFFSLIFAFFPVVFSQLPSNQTNTMVSLSEHINNTAIEWDISKGPCSWRGVVCNSNKVSHISLSGFSISTSDWLPVVCSLSSLQFLDVSDNHLSSIPDEFFRSCRGIEGLKLLNFSNNRLVGPLPTFNGFVGLEFLDLSYNFLRGNIGLQLDGLVKLKSLNLSSNLLNGSLPSHLGKSMLLEQLELSMNNFHGGIPEAVLGYRNLTLIDLRENRLSGSVPSRIGVLSRLEVLVLSSNNLSGEIPSSLMNIPTLWRFAAYENNFGGNIPSGITRYLRILDLSYNKLVGSIPADFLSQSNLQTVDLSFNMLRGPIPSNISSTMVRLRLGSNSLDGVIPSAPLGTLEKLTYLELDNNSLTGLIPLQLGSCRSLALLNLARNNLTGGLPVQLGSLSHLQVMQLQLNKLVGEIPIEITHLLRLSTLNISWNFLTGSIPSDISSLRSLTNLNLQANNLNGSIPATIGSLNSLLELQLGQNQLSGVIPMMPPKLQISLNLSHNLFEGPIPKTLSRLTELEVLDLSNNKFYGEIPDSLASMNTLTQLLLANNQLSGVIPKFKAWVKIDTNGNKDIVNATMSPTPDAESPKKRKSVAVGISLGVVAAVLAAGAVVLIALSVWRRVYRINDEEQQSGETIPFPQVKQVSLLTANGIHRSNIDFTQAMEAVTDPSNIMLKTRFSTYYKATMPSEASYLVKKLNWSDKIFQLGSHVKFEQELEVLGKLSNSNVMAPLAYVLTVDSAYLFYEFAQKGTLFDVLHGSLGNALDWASRYSIAIGVAQGLAFLHGCNPGPVLLLDLSSRSILLKSLKEPQVGDIELCKVIDPSKSTGSLSAVAGSVGYIPPEYAYTMRVTMAGNVYSFGVVLLELLTGKPAVSEGTELAKRVLSNSVKQDKWDHILDFTVRKTIPAFRSQMLAVLKVALACVSISPEARPKMKSVLLMLLNAR